MITAPIRRLTEANGDGFPEGECFCRVRESSCSKSRLIEPTVFRLRSVPITSVDALRAPKDTARVLVTVRVFLCLLSVSWITDLTANVEAFQIRFELAVPSISVSGQDSFHSACLDCHISIQIPLNSFLFYIVRPELRLSGILTLLQ